MTTGITQLDEHRELKDHPIKRAIDYNLDYTLITLKEDAVQIPFL